MGLIKLGVSYNTQKAIYPEPELHPETPERVGAAADLQYRAVVLRVSVGRTDPAGDV